MVHLPLPTLNDDDDDHTTIFVDTDIDMAYWIDNRLMRAPVRNGYIDMPAAEPVDFDMISDNVDYFAFVVDQLRA